MGFMGFVGGGGAGFGGACWVVFGLAVVAVDYVGNLVGCGFYVWW